MSTAAITESNLADEIRFYHRYTKKIETEKVYGDIFIKFVYNSALKNVIGSILASRAFSQIYGGMQNNLLTQLKVPGFVKKFDINLDDYEQGSVKVKNQALSYRNFNEFFIRKFRTGKREFIEDSATMPACAEARYFAHQNINEDTRVPVKGHYLSARDILNDDELAKEFIGGPLVVARLCPVDYHRYHYIDSGQTLKHYQIPGQYHSVNPTALKARPDIFIKNERRVSILETKNFGKIAYVEVGAMCVGRIVQTHDETKKFSRGEEKGFFLFGGSTVILLGQPATWRPSEDILENTKKGIETYIHLGDELACKL